MSKHGKKYRAALEKIDPKKTYSLDESAKLIKGTTITKFDAGVELHLNLNIDPAKADQIIRNSLVLPHGTGNEVRVVAFVDDTQKKVALDAGAIKAGDAELIEEINKGWLDFDVAVAHPDMMKKLGKIARILGQKGLMPNPKAGTISPEIEKIIKEVKRGKIEFRNDKQGNLHNLVGKVSFGEDQLKENIQTYINTIVNNRPSGVKGAFIKSITLTTTMGPGIHLEVSQFIK
ncbi:MAG: 50S ribosomal protein L1, large subunit ribosomal protein L1 [Candidatus Peregrinibacteria bacterium GW2011_GWE2_39_6]|nr:MAG: 50S ribosomal protein L1, large subunit ribosomal protein L1 [Candidatus Peregrinibacteria bacterium GW2011_GWF2_39_17]KKR25642.1 MAG: 50S ribosomal protein L1, large subunit ribosomal protein L1 [Candidatus Peregrinibacteria bacterium GW2011_GWE2_39_6]HCW32917.1 50S ribosomal protein L1 [Candidatus Peregrinibacteria bacterium]